MPGMERDRIPHHFDGRLRNPIFTQEVASRIGSVYFESAALNADTALGQPDIVKHGADIE
jgi:hypothetical protein